jgi:hypothetical protein
MQDLEKISPDIDVKALERFNSMLNTAPPDSEILVNTFANNSRYLPISFVQMKLDELFMMAWRTINYRTRVIANEIIGDIDLEVFHPILRVWLSRTGSAGAQIQMRADYEKDDNGNFIIVDGKKVKKEKDILNAGLKIENTLTKDYPHLKSECIKNAAKEYGQIFGRDLNRKSQDTYNPIYTISLTIDDVKGKLLECSDLSCLESIWNEYPEFHKHKEFIKLISSKKLQLK